MKHQSVHKKILVLRYRFIGDTILTVPFLRNLRRSEPDAYIAWVIAPGSADVVKGIPYVDELIFWDPVTTHTDSQGTHRTWGEKWGFIRELRKRRFDKVYVLKRSLSSAIIAFLSGAHQRIGFNTERRGLLLTKKIPYRHDRHEVENFLDLLRADGVEVADDYLEAWLSPEDKLSAAEFLSRQAIRKGESIIGIHPFAANHSRAWHADDFIAVANTIQKETDARILLFGGEMDRESGEYFRERIIPAPIMAVGTSTLRQTMALLARCRLLICNDSGVMHLAAALNVPLVSVFGPQSPVKFGPWGSKCRVIHKEFSCSPCRQKFFRECTPSERGKPACLEAVSIEEVRNVVKSLTEELRSISTSTSSS